MTLQLSRPRASAKLLSLILHWNVVTAVCEIMSDFPYLGFLRLVGQYSAFISLLFFAATVCMVTAMGSMRLSTFTPALWAPLLLLSVAAEPRIGIMLPRATMYYIINVACVAMLFACLNDLNDLLSRMNQYVILSTLYAVAQLTSENAASYYSMSFSYATAIPSLFCLSKATGGNGRDRLYYIPFALFFIANLKIGSRGIMLCYILLLFIEMFEFSTNREKFKRFLVAILACLVILIFWDRILTLLTMFFPNSRNIRLLITHSAVDDSGRKRYYEMLGSRFLNEPFAFRGLYSDRLFMTNYSRDMTALWGSYAHNVILEVLYQFGLIGIFLLFLLAWHTLRTLAFSKRQPDKALRTITKVIVSYSVGQLMVSSSYLISSSFGALLGLIIFCGKKMKRATSDASLTELKIDDLVSVGVRNAAKGARNNKVPLH